MSTIFFLCITPDGSYRECLFAGPDLESCFETLTGLVKSGWQLIKVSLLDSNKKPVLLPIAAFDGQSFRGPMKRLYQELELILIQQ